MKTSLVELVWDRAASQCEYCLFPAAHAWLPFQIDHVIAEKHSGATVAENLALSCYYCNSFKGPAMEVAEIVRLLVRTLTSPATTKRVGLLTSNCDFCRTQTKIRTLL